MAERTKSTQQAIDDVAVLFPYLTFEERYEWWKRLDCDLVELTIHMRNDMKKFSDFIGAQSE